MQKVNSLIQKLIAELLITEYDAQGDFVTIKDVNTTRDLSYARIFVSATANTKEHVKNLNNIARHLKKLIKPKLSFRTIPNLEFVEDTKGDSIEVVEELLN